jgi:single-strand DNA-binding protein
MLIGNLTRSPIIRETSNNVLVCSFGLATNTSWKDKQGNTQEKTEYHNIIAFNKLAEICAMVLDTSMLIFAEGELRTRVSEGPDGKKYYRTEIKLNDMSLLDSKGRKGVGIDSAKNAGTSDEKGRDEIPADVEVEEISSKEEFNSEDLF